MATERSDVRYAELETTTNFTFLAGGSHPEELVERAAAVGQHAVAVTDTNTLAGVVRAHVAAKEAGLPLVVGCRLVFTEPEAPSLLVYPTDADAYGRLSRLLTVGRRRAAKGGCSLTLPDLLAHEEGLLAVVLPPPVLGMDFLETLAGLRRAFGDRLSIGVSRLYRQDDRERLTAVAAASDHVGVPLVATNDVRYHTPERRPLQDVLTCVRYGCTVEEAGLRLLPNAERHIKPPEEMARLFADLPGAVERTVEIAERATDVRPFGRRRRTRGFSLDQLKYQYPTEVVPADKTPTDHLATLTWRGARGRYPRGVPEKVRKQVDHELRLIETLGYAHYFLTVHDLVQFARGRGILCQGRGAAANSAVCYCLGITSVDPDRVDVLFERFVSKQRNEPPDIDVDFEHERREEVIQYIYEKYGRERAALTAEVITYRARSAVRDVGKALGLSLDAVDRLAKRVDAWGRRALEAEPLRAAGLRPDEPVVQRLRELVETLIGFPRHLSQHVGGFVITEKPLCELVPIENAAMEGRTVIEWDKDDIDAMGMLKVDVLGLGMLTCIRKALQRVLDPSNGAAPSDPLPHAPASELQAPSSGPQAAPADPVALLDRIPAGDPAVYEMISSADTVGVFQIESRAQMAMLPRLKPRCFYDLIIEVSIVRPGPIQGNMVHPYLRRRSGEETPHYPDETIRRVLGKTLGVPLFQEQAMALAVEAAGFTPEEADGLRRAINAWKSQKNAMDPFRKKLIRGMVDRGYTQAFAEQCFDRIKGFSEYGFPESHAASFALLVYVSAWLKHHRPAAFTAALLNSQPVGFYGPAQLVRDAKEHGVEVRPVDVNHSGWDCLDGVRVPPAASGTADEAAAANTHRPPSPPDASSRPSCRHVGSGDRSREVLRLGMRMVRGLRREDAEAITRAVRRHGPFRSVEPLWRASGVSVTSLRRLAEADAFQSMGLDRQRALWQILRLRDEDAPLFAAAGEEPPEPKTPLPEVPEIRKVTEDYGATGLSLKNHPMAFLRPEVERMGAVPARQVADPRRWPHGRRIAVAGLCLVRQRPASASGVIFMSLEDETGVVNLILRPRIYTTYRQAARDGVVLLVRGRVERQGEVVHVMAHELTALEFPAHLHAPSRDFR